MHEISYWITLILLGVTLICFVKKSSFYSGKIKSLQIELAVLQERLFSKETALADILSKHAQQCDALMERQILIEHLKTTVSAFETEKNLVKKELESYLHKMSTEALRTTKADLFTSFQQHWHTFIEQERHSFAEKETQLKNWISPIQKEIEQLKQIHHNSQKELAATYHGLKEQLRVQWESSTLLEKETKKLCDVLRNPNTKGKWGELQLKRIVEMCGLLSYCDFEEQSTYEGKRPDLTVRLPGEKCLIIDAKTPMKGLWEDKSEEKTSGKEQVSIIKKHIQIISKRNYWSVPNQPIMVIIFFPVDSILGTAMETDPSLLEWSATHNVLLTTPSTLIGLLMTISSCWMQQTSVDNMQCIAQKSKDILEVIAQFLQDIFLLGRHLEKSVVTFNALVKSSKRKLIPSFEELRDLIGPSMKKKWSELKQISYPLE